MTAMVKEKKDKLGQPDIKLAGLEIWVHNRQFPDADDYWDGNWLNVTAHCGSHGADVWVSGTIIHLSEIAGLLSGTETLYREIKGTAELSCMEPDLSFVLEVNIKGQISVTVNITPDQFTQKHEFIFGIDQSCLPKLIEECRSVMDKYPMRGTNNP